MMNIYIKAAPEKVKKITAFLSAFFRTTQLPYAINLYSEENEKNMQNGILFFEIKGDADIAKIETMYHREHMMLILMHDDMQYLFDSFKIKAAAYIQYKSFDSDLEKLKELLRKEAVTAQCRYHYASSFMHFDIHPKNVLYIESYHHDVYIHTKYMKLKVRDNLKNYIINNQYLHVIQVHKSFVVNLSFIEVIQGNVILMKNQAEIPIGERYKAELNDLLSLQMNN